MGWQFQAFLKLGRFVERILQLQPFRPAFDGARSADAFAPMTNLLHGECELYANWFGKGLLAHGGWRDAEACIGSAMDELWSSSRVREWASYSGWSEEHRVILSRDTWRIDPWHAQRLDEDDDGDDRRNMLALDNDHFPDVGFRTACAAPPGPLASEPIQLDAMEPVPAVCASIYRR